jgi:hypothetical protein
MIASSAGTVVVVVGLGVVGAAAGRTGGRGASDDDSRSVAGAR